MRHEDKLLISMSCILFSYGYVIQNNIFMSLVMMAIGVILTIKCHSIKCLNRVIKQVMVYVVILEVITLFSGLSSLYPIILLLNIGNVVISWIWSKSSYKVIVRNGVLYVGSFMVMILFGLLLNMNYMFNFIIVIYLPLISVLFKKVLFCRIISKRKKMKYDKVVIRNICG